MPSEVDYITGTESFEQQSTLNLMTLDNKRQAWATLVYQINCETHGVYAGSFGKCNIVSMNGAATNNLQATSATNAVRQPIPVEGYLVQKKRAELMQDILNMVLESEQHLIKWGLI
jgi:hypothetical protein